MRVELANRCDPPQPEAPMEWGANPATGRSGWSMPATGAALGEGACSVEHAAVVARTMAGMPTSLDPEEFASAEGVLAGWATEYDPAELTSLGKSLLHLLDEDSLEDTVRL